MDWLFVLLTAPTALGWLAALLATLYMVRVIRPLEASAFDPERAPRVSIISPACNEQARIEQAIRSWLAQRQLSLQVVVVDDRSSDDTGAIIDRLASEDDRIVAVHVDALPDGWLGKVHALHRGVEQADGDWLLFADADVHLAPAAVARAVAFAETEGVDLLTAYPEIASAGFVGDVAWSIMGATAGPSGLWRTRDPDSTFAFAVGAFILVRRRAFDQTPGLSWIKLEVADDQGLAILLKAHGHRCDIVNGRGQVKLTWYASFGEMVRKSQKNWFGIMGRFSLLRCLAIAALLSCAALSPLAALLPGVSSALLPIPAVGIAALWGAAAIQARWSGRPMLPVLLSPLGMLLVAFMVVRAGFIGRQLGGIRWRGVTYASELLRGAQRFKM